MEDPILQMAKVTDLAIVTAKCEELHPIKDAMAAWGTQDKNIEVEFGDRLLCKTDGNTYYPGKISCNGASISFFLTSCHRQGIQPAAIFCTRLFTRLKPEYCIMLGICCGNKDRTNLTDVVFGSIAFNTTEGKVLSSGEKQHAPFCVEAAGIFAQLMNDIAANKSSHSLSWSKGSFLTVAEVREDAKEVFEEFNKTCDRKANALDMEASAFLEAAHKCGVKAMGVIKAVVDFGDAKKSDNVHTKGLAEAWKAAAQLILRYVEDTQSQSDMVVENGTGEIHSKAAQYANLLQQRSEMNAKIQKLENILIDEIDPDDFETAKKADIDHAVFVKTEKKTRPWNEKLLYDAGVPCEHVQRCLELIKDSEEMNERLELVKLRTLEKRKRKKSKQNNTQSSKKQRN